jgi:Lrp/AsnC family transcriptional regulator, regulator for asnA, asnC and gidA
MSLDELDHRVIKAFQANGRVSNREVARQLGVSEATVRSRVRRLEEAGVVRIRAVGDATRARGLAANAIIGITVAAGQVEAVMEKLLDHPEISVASTTIGRHDIIIGCALPDAEGLAEFILRRINRIPGITRSVTFPAVSVVKHDFNWVRLVKP